MPPASITLFFDCLSPFAYLGYRTLRRYQPLWNVDVVLKPVLLGGVMVRVAHAASCGLRPMRVACGLLLPAPCRPFCGRARGRARVWARRAFEFVCMHARVGVLEYDTLT